LPEAKVASIRRAERSLITKEKELLYSDFLTGFLIGSNINDLQLLENEDSVKQSILNLLLTNTGERLYNNSFGCDLNKLLFENSTPQTISAIIDLIRSTIENFESRVRVLDVLVSPIQDDSAYAVTVYFSVINKTEPITLEFLLDRIR